MDLRLTDESDVRNGNSTDNFNSLSDTPENVRNVTSEILRVYGELHK